ncbi:MAG: STAS domain-containing protein [Candidatus Magnetominusculus sp. LBB02]|nr:STAS domain-containing protein [Candidatus Magnetominusculus sp. LBB02]
MEIKKEKVKELDVISIIGRVDATNASQLDEAVQGVLAGGSAAGVILSLKGLEYVSSAGLRVFIAAAKETKKTGVRLAFAEVNEQVMKVLKMSGLEAILKIYETMDEAVSGA